jgi:hypothetical protein
MDDDVVMGTYEDEYVLDAPVIDLGPLQPTLVPGDFEGMED